MRTSGFDDLMRDKLDVTALAIVLRQVTAEAFVAPSVSESLQLTINLVLDCGFEA